MINKLPEAQMKLSPYLRPLLSAGLAVSAGLASAQSNVTIGGFLDLGMYRDSKSVTKVGTIQRSHLQFSGSEDLGGGLSTTFKLRQRFELETGALEGAGSKPMWHGESTVGLKGSLGSFRMGRATDAIQSQDWAFDPWENFNRVASPAWDLWHWNYSADPVGGGSGRVASAVFLDSAKFANFTGHVSFSPNKPDGAVGKTQAAAVVFNNGTTRVMLGSAKNSAGAKETSIGLRNAFDALSVMGMYNVSETASGSKAKVTTLGATYALGATSLKAGWGSVDVKGQKLERILSFGASYSLSKRTSVYADIASKRYLADGTKTVYGVGLAHSF